MWFSWLEAYSLHIMDDGRMLSSQSLFSLLDVSCCLGWDFITTASTTQLWDCVSAWRLWTALLVYFCPLIKSQSDTILKRPALRSNGALSLRPDYFLLGVLLTSDLCLDTLTWRPSQAWIYHSLNLFSSGSASLHGSYSLLVSHQSLTLRTRHYLATWISKYAGHSYFPESPLFLKKWSLMTFNRYSLSGAQLCEAQVFYSNEQMGVPSCPCPVTETPGRLPFHLSLPSYGTHTQSSHSGCTERQMKGVFNKFIFSGFILCLIA